MVQLNISTIECSNDVIAFLTTTFPPFLKKKIHNINNKILKQGVIG